MTRKITLSILLLLALYVIVMQFVVLESYKQVSEEAVKGHIQSSKINHKQGLKIERLEKELESAKILRK